MDDEIGTIFGHMCDGLAEFQRKGGGCTPKLTTDKDDAWAQPGTVMGCDNTNYVPFLFCPFCGVRFIKGASA